LGAVSRANPSGAHLRAGEAAWIGRMEFGTRVYSLITLIPQDVRVW